ncbi:MAG: hypothetical protein Q8K51_10985, partial [Nitrospirota bacterium]|nr:hypothetical protein [Nitrospirota bacterium]
MKVHYYTQNKALLAYIDLLGTKTLYIKNTEPLEDMARRLFEPLLAVFNVEFQNSFSEQEIRDNFCVSIYSDSIMICSKVDTADIIEKLISFLLKFQHEAIFGISDRYRVPFRALIDREPYFFIRFEQPEEGSILQSKYTTSSLLGGRGMVVMDTKLKKLPVGIYVSEKIKNELIAEIQKRA